MTTKIIGIDSEICLVACAKTKRKETSSAENLYSSALFQKCREFAKNYFQEWYILSAKYGLLKSDQLIQPYERTLKKMPRHKRRKWAEDVFKKLERRVKDNKLVVILAGMDYREFLVPLLNNNGYDVIVPMAGRSIGVQLRWLNAMNHDPHRFSHINEFYRLLAELEEGLEGKRVLGECTGQMDWPERGIYFLFEPGEMRTFDPNVPRVVRVGTHMISKDSKATLWNRLRTHRGTIKGIGNHRGSIFRLHVGTAIIAKRKNKYQIPTWGKGSTASIKVRKSEVTLEREVSKHIRKMSVLWLNVADDPGPDSDRAYLERNIIALLASRQSPLDLGSNMWLGNHCPHPSVRQSSLWNVNHIQNKYDEQVLSVVSHYVKTTLSRGKTPRHSVAPHNWRKIASGDIAPGQLRLFGGDES